MFFYITKIFWFFLQPLDLALFLMATGRLLAMLGRRLLGGTASFLAVLILVPVAQLIGPRLYSTGPGTPSSGRPNCPKRSTASWFSAAAWRAPSIWCAAAMK